MNLREKKIYLNQRTFSLKTKKKVERECKISIIHFKRRRSVFFLQK